MFGVLEQPADAAAAHMFLLRRDVLSVQDNGSFGSRRCAGDHIEERGFPRAVGAEHCHELPLRNMHGHLIQCPFFQGRPLVEYHADVLEFKHGCLVSFSVSGDAEWKS